MLCCAPLTALTASEGKLDWRLGIVGVTLCHTASAFGKGGGCLQREEVSQAVVDGGRARQEEAESSFQSFWIFHKGILHRHAAWMHWEKELVLRCTLIRQQQWLNDPERSKEIDLQLGCALYRQQDKEECWQEEFLFSLPVGKSLWWTEDQHESTASEPRERERESARLLTG